MKRRIFIGDIHGESEQLMGLIEDLNLKDTDELVFLGDYIDRGSHSKEVFDLLGQINDALPQTRFLWGNHDLMFYEWLTNKNPVYEETYEGQQTIRQFLPNDKHVQLGKAEVLQEYKWLFDRMESHADYPEQVAVHGGLNFTKTDPINGTNLYEKVNTRMFVSGNPLNKPIIVGHTPQPHIMLTDDRKMVDIDTGSGSGGELSALIYFTEYDFYTDKDGYGIEVLPLKEF